MPVRRKPRIAFIPTGSELVPAGIAPRRGQNVDTNSLMVKHMLIEYGAEPLIFPIVHDDEAALERAFAEALAVADAVVVNGGSAVGEEDFNVRMIEARGRVVHHYIAAVPGRPLMMAVADGKPVVDLPGPTMAAYYGTQWCLQAVVARFLDVPVRKIPTVQAQAAAAVSGPPQMANIARVNLVRDDNPANPSGYTAEFLNFKAGDLAACMASNAQRVSPLGEHGFEAGTLVDVELLRGEELID